MDVTVRNNTDAGSYDAVVDGQVVGMVVYERKGDRIIVRHTIVQPEHRGQGIATTLVRAALDDTPRSSSMVENLNSRLRRYFFLRRHLGEAYLSLPQFFLNHRVFMRSRRAERVGKTPKELLTGQAHAHWLELLGFERLGPA